MVNYYAFYVVVVIGDLSSEITSRVITLLGKEETSKKKKKTKKRTNFKKHEIRPVTMSEVLEMNFFPWQHFRACLSRFFLQQGNKQHRWNQAIRGWNMLIDNFLDILVL